MERVLVYSPRDEFLFELREADVSHLSSTMKINGEHYLTITTRATLSQEQRILTQDGTGKWYEWVVATVADEHVWGTYECDWSLQHDLQVSTVSRILTNNSAREAIGAALSGTSRWTVGTVNVGSTASASMYQTDGWSALSTAVETWGGEVDAKIGVDLNGVVTREVSLYNQIGQPYASRRFDYGHDVRGISRTIERFPRACRIIPLGKGEETGNGYGRKITIESVNGGVEYLQNDDMVELLKLPDGSGGYEYPTIYVENSEIEEPSDLLAWAQSVLVYYTSPMVTYEADVMQLERAGMDAHGVSLGDVVQCVDRTFRSEGLRIEGRVVELVVDGIDPAGTVVTIGHIQRSIASELAGRMGTMGGVIDAVVASGSLDLSEQYVRSVLSRINEEANLTGGFFYITEGQGARCYDKAVSDPMVGAEADAVTEIRGGTIRIANSRTSAGDWDWKTVFVNGRVLSELIDAIGSSTGYHAQLTPYGLDVYDGESRVAHFGEEVILGEPFDGYNAGNCMTLDSDGMKLYGLQGFEAMHVNADALSAFMRLAGGNVAITAQENGTVRTATIESGFTDQDESDAYSHTLALSAARHWYSDATKHDLARLFLFTDDGGVNPFAALQAESGSNSIDLRVNASGSGTGIELDGEGVYPTHGSLAQDTNVAAGGSVTRSISFGHTYASAPAVIPTLYSTSSDSGIGKLSCVVTEITTTGAKVKIFNNDSQTRAPGVRWIAIG